MEKAIQPKRMSSNRIRESMGDMVLRVIVVILVTLLSLTCLLPLVNIVATSFSSARAINSGEVAFWPVEFCLDAYDTIFTNDPLIRSMFLTIGITLLTVAIALVCTIMAAYPLSHKSLVGRKPLWLFVIFTMYFSGGMIPNYLLIRDLKLLNTIWALVLPGAISTYNMILMRSFFASIPDALTEAAIIDGANDATILTKIILPLSKSMLATIALFYGVSRWNGLQYGLLYITDPNLYTLQVRLSNIIISSESLNELMAEGSYNQVLLQTEQVRCAALCFSLLPVMLVYPFLQKYFVKGVMIGSVKG